MKKRLMSNWTIAGLQECKYMLCMLKAHILILRTTWSPRTFTENMRHHTKKSQVCSKRTKQNKAKQKTEQLLSLEK